MFQLCDRFLWYKIPGELFHYPESCANTELALKQIYMRYVVCHLLCPRYQSGQALTQKFSKLLCSKRIDFRSRLTVHHAECVHSICVDICISTKGFTYTARIQTSKMMTRDHARTNLAAGYSFTKCPCATTTDSTESTERVGHITISAWTSANRISMNDSRNLCSRVNEPAPRR